jgi:hypothetical protein
MKKLSLVVALLVPILSVTACKRADLANVESAELGAPANVTLDQVTEMIEMAGAARGWKMTPKTPGRMAAEIFVNNKHTAVVDITYDTKIFSIMYSSSINLNYSTGGSRTYIHPNYNTWVQLLKQSIKERARAM